MTTTKDLVEATFGGSPESIHAAPIRVNNALSKLADSDSEEENNAPIGKAGGGLLSRLQMESDGSSDSDEEDDYRATERAKQRLMLTKPVETLSSDDEDGDDEGAYERMRKQLMTGTGRQEQDKEHGMKAQPIYSSSDDEEDAPVRVNPARRVQPRREHTTSPPRSPSPSVRSRQSSPGLFVTPNASPTSKRTRNTSPATDSLQPTRNADFNERVERIRAERLAAQKQKREEQKRSKTARHEIDEDSDGRKSDGEDGRRLTQLTKPARKAGKKALEAMAREQQRIERGMQLTHQSKTKKRYGTKDLFAKFGFPQGVEEPDMAGLPTPDPSSLPTSSDADDGNKGHDTPPTSPPNFDDASQKDAGLTVLPTSEAMLPNHENTSLTPVNLDKGKGRAPEFQHLPPNRLLGPSDMVALQRTQIGPQKPIDTTMVDLSDSDEDLKAAQPKSRFPVFDNLPEKKKKETSSLLHLRHLAGVTSPGKKQPKGGKSMNFAQLGRSLHQKARQQAHRERQEKIEELRRKGIHVETEEEREKRQMEIEDMVAQFEKQRQEDLALAKFERKEAKANGETGDGLFSSDESEDDDYVESGEENAAEGEDEENDEDAAVELSGSEDEEAEEEADNEGELDEDAIDKPHGLLDEMADEDDLEEPKASKEGVVTAREDMEDIEPEVPIRKRAVHRARHIVVDDDDDDDDEDVDTVPQKGSPTQVVTQDNAMAAFGFGNAAPAVGLTQAFAGTMANLSSVSQDNGGMLPEQEQDSLDFLRNLPDTQPDDVFGQDHDFLIPNSQGATFQQIDSQCDAVSQLNLGISQLVDASPVFPRTQPVNSQLSEVPEPTQDAGFLMSRSPAGFHAPPSTIDTVMMQIAESPVAQRKGKLRRGRQAASVELSDIDDTNVFSGSDVDIEDRPTKAKDVFTVMKKAAKKQQKVDNFNKKTSWARDAIEEQAEESEDEYAGIGGASDDDSDAEVDEELAKMIDTGDVKVDERQLAAFYADKSRKDHEKDINQLYKDFKSGNWRKRAAGGADFELSDSEDEAEMRQRKRQRDFQQTTRALLQDERIGKIAENVKKSAFFKTLVDHYDEADYDFLNVPEDVLPEASQSQSDEHNDNNEDISVPDSQTIDPPANPRKRKSLDSQEKENRPPPNMRRTAVSDGIARKPMSMADIEHSVSELLEDPRVMVPDSQYLSDSDDELAIGLPTHTDKPRKPTIIDRLTLSRTSISSSTTTSTTTTDTNLAFHAPSNAHTPGFRVPSLIRRATSNFSTVSERSSGTNTPVEGGVRRGGTGRSNIHAQAREAERRAVMEKAEGKRKEALRKKAGKARGKRSILSGLGGGFE
jgi:mediator of replication checkpoint protein 1